MKTITVFLFSLLFTCISGITQNAVFYGKVFLQGSYDANNGIIRTDLSGTSDFPTTQPYNMLPWNYAGTETVNSVPDSVVDWLLIELRSDPYTIVARRAALLLSNGNIIDTSLVPGVEFTNSAAGSYYVVIIHKNHIPVMTSTNITLPNAPVFDFSDTLNFNAWGGDVALIELSPGTMAMIAGDVNHDNLLKYSGPSNDRAPILQKIVGLTGTTSIVTTVNGYYNEDVNMNHELKYSGPGNDPSLIIQNIVKLVGVTSIVSTYEGKVPPGTLYIPFNCGDVLTDTRDGKKYSTVQIGSQCWLAENLGIGTMIPGTDTMLNNNVIEKYCYLNDTMFCDTFGGLYQWNETMQYTTGGGGQGICPDDWHIPSDSDWKLLEGNVDSSYGLGDPVWDNIGWRGSDAGGNLKKTGFTHWFNPNKGATNSSGFTALGAGTKNYNSSAFGSLHHTAYFWTSTEFSNSHARHREMSYYTAQVSRSQYDKNYASSVRCVLDTICTPQPDQATTDPDQVNIPGDSVQLQGNTPSAGTGVWSIVSGMGGSFADSTNPGTMFYGQAGEIYELWWTISTICGSTSASVIKGFAGASWACGDSLTDNRDGQKYSTVLIGQQCWMAENLDIGNMVQGTQDMTNDSIIEKYCYNNKPMNCDEYGGLYQWNEAMMYDTNPGIQGICPAGWHFATDGEWKILEGNTDSTYVVGDIEWDNNGWRGYNSGGQLKESGFLHWSMPNTGATNAWLFTALPAGKRELGSGSFWHITTNAYFWTSSMGIIANYSYFRGLDNTHKKIHRGFSSHQYGYSIRCLKN